MAVVGRGRGRAPRGARYSGRGSVAITGRSDATLNRGGVRIGTADLYSVVEDRPEVRSGCGSGSRGQP